MATYIVNTGPNKEVHRTAYVISACNINLISPGNRIDTNEDWTVKFPLVYDGCRHCYASKHWK